MKNKFSLKVNYKDLRDRNVQSILSTIGELYIKELKNKNTSSQEQVIEKINRELQFMYYQTIVCQVALLEACIKTELESKKAKELKSVSTNAKLQKVFLHNCCDILNLKNNKGDKQLIGELKQIFTSDKSTLDDIKSITLYLRTICDYRNSFVHFEYDKLNSYDTLNLQQVYYLIKIFTKLEHILQFGYHSKKIVELPDHKISSNFVELVDETIDLIKRFNNVNMKENSQHFIEQFHKAEELVKYKKHYYSTTKTMSEQK